MSFHLVTGVGKSETSFLNDENDKVSFSNPITNDQINDKLVQFINEIS